METLEQYSTIAKFLNNPRLANHMEVNWKGDITLSKLLPGNRSDTIEYLSLTRVNLQGNIAYSAKQQRRSSKETMSTRILPHDAMTIDRSPSPESLNTSTNQKHSLRPSQDRRLQLKKSSSTVTIALKSPSITLLKRKPSSTEERSKYSERNTSRKNPSQRSVRYVGHANRTTVMIHVVPHKMRNLLRST